MVQLKNKSIQQNVDFFSQELCNFNLSPPLPCNYVVLSSAEFVTSQLVK